MYEESMGGPKKKIKIELPVIGRASLVTAGEVTLIERLSKLQVVRRKTQWWALPLRPVNNEENVVIKMLAELTGTTHEWLTSVSIQWMVAYSNLWPSLHFKGVNTRNFRLCNRISAINAKKPNKSFCKQTIILLCDVSLSLSKRSKRWMIN